MAGREEERGQGRMSAQRLWADPCGELRRLIRLEQRLLWVLRQGLRKEGAQGWPVLEFKAGSRGCSLGCYFTCLLLDGEMSGIGGQDSERCLQPVWKRRWVPSRQSLTLSQASPPQTVHRVGTVKLMHILQARCKIFGGYLPWNLFQRLGLNATDGCHWQVYFLLSLICPLGKQLFLDRLAKTCPRPSGHPPLGRSPWLGKAETPGQSVERKGTGCWLLLEERKLTAGILMACFQGRWCFPLGTAHPSNS